MVDHMELETRYCAHNYAPLPVVLVRGEGVYVWDEAGRRYIDMLGAYSAVSFGHCNPRLVAALTGQAGTLDTISRAFYSDRLGPFLERACALTGLDMALPMNTGAEAVETALKAARKWAYNVKGVAADAAEIIVCDGNFHGRTIAITGFSPVAEYRAGFGPFAPGFRQIPFGDAGALARTITPDTAAFLVEPIQGEGGIIVPPDGYLRDAAAICRENNVLLMCDEIQTGIGRTGAFLASAHDGVTPDVVTLGKALGGGVLPVSLVLARRDVMEMFTPGDHGSTFGGYPLAAAVGLEVLNLLVEDDLCARAATMGAYLMNRLQSVDSPLIADVRGRGLLAGIEFRPERIDAHVVCEQLMAHGILTKETNRNVVRFAPPLIVTEAQIDFVFDGLCAALVELEGAETAAAL